MTRRSHLRAELPVEKPAKEPSRRQLVRQCVDAHGEAAARVLGEKLGLSPTTINLYIRRWVDKTTEPATRKRPQPEVANGFRAHFRYGSRVAARRAADHQARISGLEPTVFLVVVEDGRFAFVPDHLADQYEVVECAGYVSASSKSMTPRRRFDGWKSG